MTPELVPNPLPRAPRLSRGELFWFVLLLLLCAVPRVLLAMRTADFGSDGGIYADMALHFRYGDGLRSSVSDFHHGFREFPHRSSVYPLWPIVLGLSWFVLPMRVGAVYLPSALALGAVAAAFFFGRRISIRSLLPARLPTFHSGHVAMLVLSLHHGFFLHAARPYTEPLAFLLLMLFFIRAQTLCARRSVRDGVELGAWLALLIYARAHFLVFAAAAVIALACEAVLQRRDRRALVRTAGFGAAAIATTTALFGPFILYLGTFLEKPGVGAYLRYDQARAKGASEVLEPFVEILSDSSDRWSHLRMLAEGFVLSFSPWWEEGYYDAMRSLAFAPPLLLLLALAWAVGRHREVAPHLRAWVGHPQRLWWLVLLGCTAAGFLSLHAIHKAWGASWYFNNRHGVPAVLLFSLAWMALLTFPLRAVAVSTGLLFCVGAAQAWKLQMEDAYVPVAFGRQYGLRSERQILEKWLEDRQREIGGPLVVAASQRIGRKLAWRLDRDVRKFIGFHEVSPHSSIDALLAMTGPLGARYLILSNDFFAPAAMRDPLFLEEFELVDIIVEKRPNSGRGPALIYQRRSPYPGPVWLGPDDHAYSVAGHTWTPERDDDDRRTDE